MLASRHPLWTLIVYHQSVGGRALFVLRESTGTCDEQTQYMCSLFCWMGSGQLKLCNLKLHCTLLSPSISATAGWEEQTSWRKRSMILQKCLLCDCWGTLKILEFIKAKRLLLDTFLASYPSQGFILFIAVFLSSHGPRSVKPMPFQPLQPRLVLLQCH